MPWWWHLDCVQSRYKFISKSVFFTTLKYFYNHSEQNIAYLILKSSGIWFLFNAWLILTINAFKNNEIILLINNWLTMILSTNYFRSKITSLYVPFSNHIHLWNSPLTKFVVEMYLYSFILKHSKKREPLMTFWYFIRIMYLVCSIISMFIGFVANNCHHYTTKSLYPKPNWFCKNELYLLIIITILVLNIYDNFIQYYCLYRNLS